MDSLRGVVLPSGLEAGLLEARDNRVANGKSVIVRASERAIGKIEAFTLGSAIGVLHMVEGVADHLAEFLGLGDLVTNLCVTTVLAACEVLASYDAPLLHELEGGVEAVAVRNAWPRGFFGSTLTQRLINDSGDVSAEIQTSVVAGSHLVGSLDDLLAAVKPRRDPQPREREEIGMSFRESGLRVRLWCSGNDWFRSRFLTPAPKRDDGQNNTEREEKEGQESEHQHSLQTACMMLALTCRASSGRGDEIGVVTRGV